MADREEFVGPGHAELADALGTSWFWVLSDHPRSFTVGAASGETVRVYVTELPHAVEVAVVVETDDVVTYHATRQDASRLQVSARAPEIVVESTFGSTVARLEVSLTPRLAIRDQIRPEYVDAASLRPV